MNSYANPSHAHYRAIRANIAALTLLGLAACGGQTPTADLSQAPLAGAMIGGDVALVDEAGRDVSFADYDGKYRMVYFGYAYCPDICPYDVQRMAKGYKDFKKDNPERAAKITPMFISVDHERDTPEVVAEFTDAFSEDMIGFTGSSEQIEAAAKAFSVFYTKLEETQPGAYLMNHSRAAFLMAPDGSPIALLPVDEGSEGVTEVLETWVS